MSLCKAPPYPHGVVSAVKLVVRQKKDLVCSLACPLVCTWHGHGVKEEHVCLGTCQFRRKSIAWARNLMEMCFSIPARAEGTLHHLGEVTVPGED